MIAFDKVTGCGSLVDISERGDSQGVSLLFFFFAVQPGGMKMYRDFHRQYYWSGTKKHVADFVRQCLTCEQVKAEHQRPVGLL